MHAYTHTNTCREIVLLAHRSSETSSKYYNTFYLYHYVTLLATHDGLLPMMHKNTHTQSVNRLAYLYAHAYKKKLPLAHWSQKTFNKYYNTTALLCETRFACFPVRGAECHADGPVCTPSQPVGVYQGTKKDQWWWQGHTHPHVAHAAQYLNCLVHTEPRTFLQTMQTEPKSKYGRKWCSFLAPACWIKI